MNSSSLFSQVPPSLLNFSSIAQLLLSGDSQEILTFPFEYLIISFLVLLYLIFFSIICCAKKFLFAC